MEKRKRTKVSDGFPANRLYGRLSEMEWVIRDSIDLEVIHAGGYVEFDEETNPYYSVVELRPNVMVVAKTTHHAMKVYTDDESNITQVLCDVEYDIDGAHKQYEVWIDIHEMCTAELVHIFECIRKQTDE